MPSACLRALSLAALLLTVPVTAISGARSAEAAETPKATVEELNAALLDTMKNADALGYQGRYDKLAPVLKETFDFPAMAQVILGAYWSSISDAQQQAFIETFTDYSIGVFADRFNGFEGERFEVLGEEEARRGAMLVRNQIVKGDGEAVAINYLVKPDIKPEKGTANWRIVDTILGGMASELATRRAEYDGIMDKLGVDGLIRALKKKTAAFAEN